MLSPIAQVRLQQLENNVTRILLLINDYEVELSDEYDPGIKNKYRRRIEDLKQQREKYEKELKSIQGQLTNNKPEGQISAIECQLQQIDDKLNWLAGGQAALHQAVLAYFTTEEKAIVDPVAKQLEKTQILEVESALEKVESNQVSEEETKLVVSQLQKALIFLKEQNLELPSGNEAIVEVLNYPAIDAKHALKVSIPIIPFILSYEGELGLGAGVKIREAWDRWKNKL